jgi:hypothetical protein
MWITFSTPPAVTQDELLTLLDKITQNLAGIKIIDQCAGWYLDCQIQAAVTGLIVGAALFPIIGDEMGLMLEELQCIHVVVDHKNYIATLTTIAPIRSTMGDKFLLKEMDHAISTFSRSYVNFSFIYKHIAIITEGGRLQDDCRAIGAEWLFSAANYRPLDICLIE